MRQKRVGTDGVERTHTRGGCGRGRQVWGDTAPGKRVPEEPLEVDESRKDSFLEPGEGGSTSLMTP